MLRTAPALARLAARGQVATRFPALTRLAIRHRWKELRECLQLAVSPADWYQLQHAFAVPALRLYGRGQLARWQAQDRSRQYLTHLAGLA